MFSILVVDDSRLVRKRLIDHLREIDGVDTIDELSDGNNVIQFILNYRPDIVILDIHLPAKNGVKIVEEFKTYQLDTIIIIFTGYACSQYKKIFKNLGVDYFFEKTNDFTNMINLIKKLCTIKIRRNSIENLITN